MSTSCCIDGRPPKDQAFENLVVQKRVTACETNTRSLCATTANIVDGDADTFNVTNLTVTNLTVNNNFNNNLPQNIFFNGTTVTNPAYVLLPTIEVSESSNGITVQSWPTQFGGTGWNYNGFGQLIISPPNANINNYIRWDGIGFPSAGTFSLRAYGQVSASSGIFQAIVDGIPVGTTNDMSTGSVRLLLFDNIPISAGTHSIGIQCVGTNSVDFAGQFLAEFFLLVQTA